MSGAATSIVRRRAGGTDVAAHLAEQLTQSDAAGALQALGTGAALAEMHARAWLAAHPVWSAGLALLVAYALWRVTRAFWNVNAL